MLKNGLIGFVLGVVTGLFGVAAHAGFVSIPVLGLLFAALLVGAGAWFTIEWFDIFAWIVYLVAVFAVTAFLLLVPHTSDVLIGPGGDMWVSEVYIVLAPIAAIVPAFLVMRADKKKTKQ